MGSASDAVRKFFKRTYVSPNTGLMLNRIIRKSRTSTHVYMIDMCSEPNVVLDNDFRRIGIFKKVKNANRKIVLLNNEKSSYSKE